MAFVSQTQRDEDNFEVQAFRQHSQEIVAY
jgi:hypothetical protein